MNLTNFCQRLANAQALNQTQKALAVLWYHDEQQPDVIMSSGQIAKIMYEMGVGNPNSTQLAERLRKSRKVIALKSGFRLKAIARTDIRTYLEPMLGAAQPAVDQDLGFLPRDVWNNTRGYLEKVCEQLNGCFQLHFYDAASVMLRRIIETLIIECYEHLQRENEIKGKDNNYLMLRDLIKKATNAGGLTLGRDAVKALNDIKELGDRSAHNRRYNAVKADLEKIQSGVRVVVDEMVNVASLRRNAKP